MTQKGEHTWDLIIDYQHCPKCGYIVESRTDYHYLMGSWVKEIDCERCRNTWSVKKKMKPTFGPLIGTPQPPEIEWI